MTDQNLVFFEKFIELYQDIVLHNGYGDIDVHIRITGGRQKEVRLCCGKEYRFLVKAPDKTGGVMTYKVVGKYNRGTMYSGPERRTKKIRRNYNGMRRRQNEPRNFKLERRFATERRKGRGRRRND